MNDRCFNTWPRNNNNNNNNNTQDESRPRDCDTTSNGIPLDQLLQSFPLAYSPVTRQLHVISTPITEIPSDNSKCNDSSPLSSLSSLSACGPSNDDDSSDAISIDAYSNKNLLGPQLKQRSFSNFFSRGLFSWKTTKTDTIGVESSNNNGTWKLFSRNSQSRRDSINTDESSSMSSSSHVEASGGSLILEPRPAHLPAKSQEEELRHRLQYQEMVQAAKKKEIKEAKLKRKQLQEQLKAEDQLANAARIWNSEILPKWESVHTTKKVRDMWWLGLPPCVRGKVWRLAVGNELNLTPDLYEICVSRALERLKCVESNSNVNQTTDNVDKESTVELIQLDISRTFPLLCIFQKGGPYYDVLHSLLGAYVCYRPDIGYIQGMSFIAAVLILNLEVSDAFVCFANLLNRPCQRAFFRLNEPLMNSYFATFNQLFQENIPQLYKHFQLQGLSPDLFLLDWFYAMFSRSMPLDVACRVWDVYFRDGEQFLFRTALGILHLYQDNLLTLDFLHGAQFLTKLPDDLPTDALFKSIENIKMSVNKIKFNDLLNQNTELLKGSESV